MPIGVASGFYIELITYKLKDYFPLPFISSFHFRKCDLSLRSFWFSETTVCIFVVPTKGAVCKVLSLVNLNDAVASKRN